MTLFEYLATASSLLYSVAALRILGGIPSSAAPQRRYALHLALTFNSLLLIVLSFWTFWSYRDVAWTFRGFAVALLLPGLLYYCAAVLVPENPEHVLSWREHFCAVRRRWFIGFALWGIAAGTSATINLGMPFAHRARSVHIGAVLLGLAGVTLSKPVYQALIATVIAVLLVGGALNPTIDADWLKQP
jgi:hypothetical protein